MSSPSFCLVWATSVFSRDAEIFLIGNDRQLIKWAVGDLQTRQPKGLYRLKVTRAAAAVESFVELDGDLEIPMVEVAGLDTVVPFIRTIGAANHQGIENLARWVDSRCRPSAHRSHACGH